MGSKKKGKQRGFVDVGVIYYVFLYTEFMAAAIVKVTETQKIEHYKALSFQSNSLPHVIWTGKQRIEVTAIPTKYKYSTPTPYQSKAKWAQKKTYLQLLLTC